MAVETNGSDESKYTMMEIHDAMVVNIVEVDLFSRSGICGDCCKHYGGFQINILL